MTTDIFNRPPNISEDTLQYALYASRELSNRASITTLAACIHSYVDAILTPAFLWHRDLFELKVAQHPDSDSQWILDGRMRVGDCVDDEWCVVWLLKEISAKWDVAISVSDSDGEFLLIEAADALPFWVTPSNSENRVWIYASHLHLIPLTHMSSPSRKRRRRSHLAQDSNDEDNIQVDDEDEFLAVEDALALVKDSTIYTRASEEVENLAMERAKRYPEALRRHVHATNAYLPLDIARALSVKPALIQKAVEAFYTRDAGQLRVAHKMGRFSPSSEVVSTVHMTRTAYAQLSGQKFFPPKVFGRWMEAEGSKEWRWRDVGMKIAVGFEILFQESKRKTFADSANIHEAVATAKKDALRRDPEYQKYIQNLVGVSFFKGELQGSQQWNMLEDKAVDVFINVRKEDNHTRESFASSVSSALSQSPEMGLYLKNEDDDSWLNIDADDFDDLLRRSVGRQDTDASKPEETEEERITSEQASRLKDLASQVEQFVEGEGDMEGARFEDEELSDDEFSDGTMSDNDDLSPKNSGNRQQYMDNLVPRLDPAEYGQMPASFHDKSQKVMRSADGNTSMDGIEEISAAQTEQSKPKPLRQPILPRDIYDGVDSDDETDEEDATVDSEDEESQPQVVGNVEVDMEEEEEEFLEFARQTLGLTDQQWSDMIKDRKQRGAFVPKTVKLSNMNLSANSHETVYRVPEAGPRPNTNPNLDSFEAVMQAMDAELARQRSTTDGKDKDKDKGKGKVVPAEEDIDAVMEAELNAAMEDRDEMCEEPMDYNLIKNFLESFKSQGGLAGPVGNLAGRLQHGWKLPRDVV